MTRTRIGLTLATLAVSLLGIAACGPATDTSGLSPEGQALAALGFDISDLAVEQIDPPAAVPSASAAPDGGAGRHKAGRARVLLRRNVLHGEAVVQTDSGTRAVDVQRGTVTAIDATSVTVRSTDGFTLTWKLGTPLRVIEHRTTVQASAVKVGATIGIAGTREGETVTARLIVLAQPK